MRRLEILLLACELVTLFVIVVSLRPSLRWVRQVALAVLPLAIVQALVEGPRWQMVPAYALAATFFLVWVFTTAGSPHRPPERTGIRHAGFPLVVSLGVAVLAMAIFVPWALPVTGLDGFRQLNTFQIEELVSQGYIVAGLDQPYTAAAVVFPDGRRVAGASRAQTRRLIERPDRVRALIEQSVRPVNPAPTLHGRPFPDGIVPFLAQDVVFTLDRLAELDRADRGASSRGGWTCGTPPRSGSRSGASSRERRVTGTRACGPAW